MEDVEAWEWHEQHRLGRRIIGDIYVEDAFEPYSDVPEDEDIDFEDDLLGFDPDTAEQQQDEVPVPEWINSAIDVDKLMSDIFRPGTNHVTDGMRGGGKTHQAVAYTEYMVEGRFKGMPRVIMLTNIIFVKRVSFEGDLEDQFVMEDPPGVHHVTSMEQMFRIQTKMMKRYGREGVMFMLVLDEAQNFLLADEYQQDTSIAFIKFYGTTRKFNTCIWLLTPSINNLPPRARNFLDADPAGYVSCQWRKNKQLAAQYIAANHIENADVREFTTMKMGANMAPVWFRITTTPWTRPLEELGIGEYGYDHLANADFKVSIDDNNPFDFKAFMEATSDMPSYRMATVMQEFFDRMDGKSADPDAPPEDDPKAERTAEILRMRELGLTFDQIEFVTGVAASTCRYWINRYGSANPAAQAVDSPKGAGGGDPAQPKRGNRSRNTPKVGSRAGKKGLKTPPKRLRKDSALEKLELLKKDTARSLSSSNATTPSSRPYMYNPREGEEDGGSRGRLPIDPQPVGGRLAAGTPLEGEDSADLNHDEDGSFDDGVWGYGDDGGSDEEEPYGVGEEYEEAERSPQEE